MTSDKPVCTYCGTGDKPCGKVAVWVTSIRVSLVIAAVWACETHKTVVEELMPAMVEHEHEGKIVRHPTTVFSLVEPSPIWNRLSELEAMGEPTAQSHQRMFTCDRCGEFIFPQHGKWVHSQQGGPDEYDHEAMPG